MNWDYMLDPPEDDEVDEERRRQDEEDKAQELAEDYELGWYN